MTPTTLAAVALTISAAGFATAATAKPPTDLPITATYSPASQRYCLRPGTHEEAAATRIGINQRQCMTARQWRVHGVRFAPPPIATASRM